MINYYWRTLFRRCFLFYSLSSQFVFFFSFAEGTHKTFCYEYKFITQSTLSLFVFCCCIDGEANALCEHPQHIVKPIEWLVAPSNDEAINWQASAPTQLRLCFIGVFFFSRKVELKWMSNRKGVGNISNFKFPIPTHFFFLLFSIAKNTSSHVLFYIIFDIFNLIFWEYTFLLFDG